MVIRQERVGVEKKFFELCSKVVEGEGLQVYDMDYFPGSHELRLYIANGETGTALIEDCIKVDKALTPYIEEEEWMPEELTLEVSSPGVYRSLTSIEHFESAVGEMIELTLKSKLNDPKVEKLPKKLRGQKKFVAQLLKVDETKLEVEIENIKFDFKFDEIKKANLEVELARE